jgi:hypothetical protein
MTDWPGETSGDSEVEWSFPCQTFSSTYQLPLTLYPTFESLSGFSDRSPSLRKSLSLENLGDEKTTSKQFGSAAIHA